MHQSVFLSRDNDQEDKRSVTGMQPFILLPQRGTVPKVITVMWDLRIAAAKRLTISSVTRCSKDVGSLKDTGSVILVMSFPIMDLRMPLHYVSG